MATSKINSVFPYPVQTVWNIVTDLEGYQWRSDLSRVEVLSPQQFVEHTKDGFATTFTVTVCHPCRRLEFDLENGNLSGHWTGEFTERDGQTEIAFTEDVTAKKLFMRPFVKSYLKKQQMQYVADLRSACEKRAH